MGLIQADMKFKAMKRIVHFNVILPADEEAQPLEAYPTLYLLHGIYGNSTSWLANSNIRRYAEQHRLAVVMPDGENGFYLNHPEHMNNFSDFIGEELVDFTRRLLPLSRKREDTYIGGLSMGGYGALVNGLRFPETFSRIVALSAGLVLDDYVANGDGASDIHGAGYYGAMFGPVETVLESPANPVWLAKQLLAAGRPLPEILMSCGVDDFLLSANRKAVRDFEAMGVPVTFRTAPGAHEWDFWDREIKHAIEHWLPQPGASGAHSDIAH